MARVRCYGGTLHGEFVDIDERYPYLRAPTKRFIDERPTFLDARMPIVYEPLQIETYQMDMWRERRGFGYREMRVALLEGVRCFHMRSIRLIVTSVLKCGNQFIRRTSSRSSMRGSHGVPIVTPKTSVT